MVQPIPSAQMRLETSLAEPIHSATGKDALSFLASTMAHDLNNILQVIFGNLSLLEREGVAEGSRHRVANALAALQSGVELTANVLEYCRQRETVAPVETLISAGQIRAMAPVLCDAVGSGVEVMVSASEGLWPFRTNVHRLQNALLNLATNARDAMQGRGRLLVCATNVSCPINGDRIWLTIADNGPGIAAEVLDRVFTPFFTTKPHGTGLGLASVAEFARGCGADVAIDSRAGLGTRFTIEFPRCL